MKKKSRSISVRTLKEICRLYYNFDLSIRAIARACNISSSTAHSYIFKLKEKGMTYEQIKSMNEAELNALFNPPTRAKSNTSEKLPDFNYLLNESKRKGVTLQILYEEYIENNPDGYSRSQFYYLYRNWKKNSSPTMRLTHKNGEKMFVDFSGKKPHYINPNTGELIEAELFISVLGGSSYTFACAVKNQSIENFISCNIKSFEYFGGCPECLVPDNLKSAVTKADYYDPEINKTFADMAEHYDIAVVPTRVAKPKDKAKAENAVLNIQRRILAGIRNRNFFSLQELNSAITAELKKFNERPMQLLKKSRYELYIENEKNILKPLPPVRFDIFHWKTATVSLDYHVNVENSHYSVPYTLIGKKVDIRHNTRVIEIFSKGKRVASHLKSEVRGAFTTDKSHMCHEHLRYLEWTPARIKEQAQLIGPYTAVFIDKLFETKKSTDNAFRGGLGVIRLSKKHTPQRVELACKLALSAKAYNYSNVKHILNNGMDTIEQKNCENKKRPTKHSNLRGTNYYKELTDDTKYH